MKFAPLASGLVFCVVHASAQDDLLRFENGDQLHGEFHGIVAGGGIRFQNAEMKEPAEFGVGSLRQLVLRGGKPEHPVETLTHAVLANGDRIPGSIVAMNDTHVSLDSGFAGTLQIPRDQLSMLAVSPMGGQIHYFGPFSEDGWSILKDEKDRKDEKKPDEKEPSSWEFSGSSWYWKGSENPVIRSGNLASQILSLSDVMSDQSVLRFRIDWRDRLGVSIAFHADMAPGDPKDDTDEMKSSREQRSIPSLFGNAYVVQLYSSHLMLYRSVWGKDEVLFDRIQTSATSLQLRDDRSALVEIRSNRRNGRISLFVNDEFFAQWNEPPADAADGEMFCGKGGSIGFSALPGMGSVRISEVLSSEWNGLPDSARSMELDDKDVVLMNNGTDRFSGKVLGLDAQRKVTFEGNHGNMIIPLDEISEIRFAKSSLDRSEKAAEQGTSLFHISPVGRMSASILSGDKEMLQLQHPLLGAIEMRTSPLIMIEYQSGERISDLWNDDL